MRVVGLGCDVGFLLGAERAGAYVLAAWHEDPDWLEVLRGSFSSSVVSAPTDLASLPHPDCAMVSEESGDWPWEICNRIRPRVVCYETQTTKERLQGYKPYRDCLNAKDFGIPQDRYRAYVVAFRDDIKPAFLSFPFPDPTHASKTIKDILEPERKDLVWNEAALEAIRKRDERNLEFGVRFKCKFLSPQDLLPALTTRYGKDKSGFLIETPEGKRTLSLLEAQRAMGLLSRLPFPDGPKGFSMVASCVCPPVAEALVSEIGVWLFGPGGGICKWNRTS